jgi:hypothetical protein
VELGYHPSISDKLFLELNRGNISYLVCNKTHVPLKSGNYELMDADLLENVFKTNVVFQQIFASVHLNFRNADFVLLPQELSSEDNNKKAFGMNYQLKFDERLKSGFIGNAIEIVYRTPFHLLEVIKNTFPGVQCKHELEFFCKCWFGTAINSYSSDIFASLSREKLLLTIRSKGSIIFANLFDVNTMDDIFYFCMLAVEQLELDIEQLNMHWLLEDTKVELEHIKARFGPYIGNIRPYLFDIQAEQEKFPLIAENNGYKAIMQCVS